jgi:hypothetical protein
MGGPRRDIEYVRSLAREKGGECLSQAFLGMGKPHLFRCKNGHEWEKEPNQIRYVWCRLCFLQKPRVYEKRDIEFVRDLARKNGGECLSPVYLGMSKKHKFRCAARHEWEATAGSVRSGRWCSRCSKHAPRNIEYVQELAKDNGGICLTETYSGMDGRYVFQCENGHEWSAVAAKIQIGQWCPECYNDNKKCTIEDVHGFARKQGGECLEFEYKGLKGFYLFRCGDCRHEWQAKAEKIKVGQWCPKCQYSKGEKNAMAFLSSACGLPFSKVRPKWLPSPKGKKMELDGYCEQAGLAIEYQGGQHYSYIPSLFHKEGPQAFARQQERDRLKAELVAARGILLLPIRASLKADPASVRAAVVKAAEDACFPLLGVNREFTEMCVRMGRPPMHRFSACLPYAAFLACVGE